jgi:general secretion pathway protein M
MMLQPINVILLGRPYLAISSYALAFFVFVGIATVSFLGLLESHRALGDQWDALERLNGRMRGAQRTVLADVPSHPRAVFHEGESAAIAHATLLQRAAQIIARAGGTLYSSEVQADLPQEKSKSIKVTTVLEIDQGGLQAMVYNIETSEPLLFIESMLINTPPGGEKKLRVVMQISGQWAGAK